VVAITSRQAGDRVRALSLGADDAVDQQTDIGELTARIQAVFRRHRGYSRSLFEVGDLSL
jgi:DNA-binding response OmpR family regulator